MKTSSWLGRLAAGSACALWLGSASAGEPALKEASSPTVWVSANSPAAGYTALAVGTGLLAFASGTIVGGTTSFATGRGELGGLPGLVTMGTILPFTVVPGLIMLAVRAREANPGARTSDAPDRFMTRSDVEGKRAAARGVMIAGAIITGLSTVAIAAGPPLFAACFHPGCQSPAEDVGLGLMYLSVPLSIVGTVGMGIGAHNYVKYNYALNPQKYEGKAAPALTSFRLLPYASQGGSGLLLSGTF